MKRRLGLGRHASAPRPRGTEFLSQDPVGLSPSRVAGSQILSHGSHKAKGTTRSVRVQREAWQGMTQEQEVFTAGSQVGSQSPQGQGAVTSPPPFGFAFQKLPSSSLAPMSPAHRARLGKWEGDLGARVRCCQCRTSSTRIQKENPAETEGR